MESSAIRAICQEEGIPGATIRVISDAADYDLPLDFNSLMTPDCRINHLKLAGTLLRAPGKISELMTFQANLPSHNAISYLPCWSYCLTEEVDGDASGAGGFASSTFSE